MNRVLSLQQLSVKGATLMDDDFFDSTSSYFACICSSHSDSQCVVAGHAPFFMAA